MTASASFPLPPEPRAAIGGYSDEDLRRLFHVEGLRSLGLSLAQIAEVIEQPSFDPARLVDDMITRARDQIARGHELVRRLREVQSTAPTSWGDVLRTVELIGGLESASPARRQQLALTVADSDERDVPVVVEAMLQETAEDAAGALQWVIARHGDAAVDTLAAALSAQNEDRRRRALDALVKVDSPAARRVIMDASDHCDPRIRSHAIRTRAQHGDSGTISALVDLVSTGRDDVEAADALGHLVRHGVAAEVIVEALAVELRDVDASARRRLTEALSDLPRSATHEMLVGLVDDADQATAFTARGILQAQASPNTTSRAAPTPGAVPTEE